MAQPDGSASADTESPESGTFDACLDDFSRLASFDDAGDSGGVAVGQRLESFSLETCDGEPLSLEQLHGGAEALLINVAAGFCIPCAEESATLEAKVFRAYCGRGLRVAQILFADDLARPTTSLFCGQWRDRYGLSFPVLKDPLFSSEALYGGELVETPLNIIVDRDGVVRYRSSGDVDPDLTTPIEEVLQ